MLERRDRLGLAPEALAHAVVTGAFEAEDLDRDGSRRRESRAS